MTEALKYSLLALLFGLMIFMLGFLYTTHEKNIRQTQNINTVLETSNVGQLRASFDEDKNKGGIGTIQPDATINEIITQIAKRYSTLDTKLDYVFFDDKGNALSENEAKAKDKNIVSVQYKVSVLDKNGEVQSTSTERLVLNKYIK